MRRRRLAAQLLSALLALLLRRSVAFVACTPYLSCFEVADGALVLLSEIYWCPPGGDWSACALRSFDLRVRVRDHAGDVGAAVAAAAAALGLDAAQTNVTRRSVCQAVLGTSRNQTSS